MTTRTVLGRPMTDRTIAAIVAAAVVVVLVVVGGVLLLTGRNSHPTSTPTSSSSTAATSSTSSTGSGPSTSAGGSTALAQQFRMGAVPPDQTAAGQGAAFDSLEQSANVKLSILHVYRGKMDTPIGGAVVQEAVNAGRTLLISWAGGDTRAMAAGTYDALIAQRAREVAALKVPVLFEYRWEMDRQNLQPTVHSPADYITAWKHVRTIFAAQKVTNAEFVWCPLATGFANGTTNATAYYPGDDSVDWVCADLYPPTSGAQVGFAQLAAPFLSWAAQHDKPIIFGEFGVPKSYGAKRAAWLAAIKPVVQQHPKIRALVYFDSVGTHRDYRLGDDNNALAALGALGRSFGVRAAR